MYQFALDKLKVSVFVMIWLLYIKNKVVLAEMINKVDIVSENTKRDKL